MPSPYSEHGFDPTLGGRLPALSFEAPLHDERWRRLLINSADLPVAWRTNDIYLGIENHDVTFISAPVGSGKSTFIPTMVALTGDNRVLCCEPRRDLTEDLGLRTSHILGESLGQTVAFRHAERKRGGGNAKLLYCTAGLALEL